MIPALRNIIEKSKLPEAKVHALWLLDGLQAIGKKEISQALISKDSGVRENGIRVAEKYLSGILS